MKNYAGRKKDERRLNQSENYRRADDFVWSGTMSFLEPAVSEIILTTGSHKCQAKSFDLKAKNTAPTMHSAAQR